MRVAFVLLIAAIVLYARAQHIVNPPPVDDPAEADRIANAVQQTINATRDYENERLKERYNLLRVVHSAYQQGYLPQNDTDLFMQLFGAVVNQPLYPNTTSTPKPATNVTNATQHTRDDPQWIELYAFQGYCEHPPGSFAASGLTAVSRGCRFEGNSLETASSYIGNQFAASGEYFTTIERACFDFGWSHLTEASFFELKWIFEPTTANWAFSYESEQVFSGWEVWLSSAFKLYIFGENQKETDAYFGFDFGAWDKTLSPVLTGIWPSQSGSAFIRGTRWQHTALYNENPHVYQPGWYDIVLCSEHYHSAYMSYIKTRQSARSVYRIPKFYVRTRPVV